MPTPLLGQPVATAFQLQNYLHQVNPNAPDLATWYLSIGLKYGVRGDIAFCQSILETNYWRFGNLVRADQNNYGGIGAVGGEERGAIFSTPQAGIEAQIQHLYAYGTTLPLPANTVPLDPRFGLVARGSVVNWEGLSGHWATDPNYGVKILAIYQDLLATQGALNPPAQNGTGTATGTPGAPSGSGGPSTPGNTGTPAGSVGSSSPGTPGAPSGSGGASSPGTPGSPSGTGGASSPNTAVPVTQLFTDIRPNAWYTAYVQRVVDLGIMRGQGDNLFHPDDTATRAELAVALYGLYQALQNKS